MISAMYENGGNATHRFLDGHPQLFVYPFESQLGTRLVGDHLASLFPVKYRWPVFALHATPREDYETIIDEECRVRARTPHVSKFRHVAFDFSDEDRRAIYERYVGETGRSRAANVAAFFRATFHAWRNHARTGAEVAYVGYSPIVVVDADRILADFPQAHVLHVVRNPWSAYADTKRRPVPLPLPQYMLAWTVSQYHALIFSERFPGQVHIVRAEDIMAGPLATLGTLCDRLGLERAEALRRPSWNSQPLEEVYPWGTLRAVTPEANLATARELSEEERADIRSFAWQYLDAFDYKRFL
ncbi:MAG: sulfotransferase [Candidatus Rokubacteria bacterium]|nr:sulfotransferase [Candidatus Rokubacteria bacterium]